MGSSIIFENTNKITSSVDIFIIRVVYYFHKNNTDKSYNQLKDILETTGISNQQFDWAIKELGLIIQ